MSAKKDAAITGALGKVAEESAKISNNLAKDIINREMEYRETYGPIFGDRISEEDKSYFEKFGNSLVDQMEVVALESNLDSETMRDEFEELINNINNLTDDTEQYYIVETAQLACSMQTDEERTLQYKNGTIKSIPKMEQENEKGKILISQLQIPEDRPAEYGLHSPAIVTDTKGGLWGEIRKNKQEEETANGLNFISFGNCQYIQNGTKLEDLAKKLYDSIPASERNVTLTEIEERMVKAIEQGYGTCYCFMKPESEWENFPAGLSISSGVLEYDAEAYQSFNDVEEINMMSMLFCTRGGIIAATESGQIKYTGIEDIFTDLEKELLKKFPEKFEYENWSEEQKKCARALWEELYADGEGDFDAFFVAGMIGNMYREAVCGQLQYKDWSPYSQICQSGKIITNLEQAYDACLVAPDKYGIGMFQFSDVENKKMLYNNYSIHASEDKTLSIDQLISAEVKTIQEELNENKQDVYRYYQQFDLFDDSVNYVITRATCVFFRKYEAPGTFQDVDRNDYSVVERAWNDAQNAQTWDEVPSICQRIIGAKIAFMEFMED